LEIQLFTPYPKQEEFLNRFLESEELFSVVISPRGAGKTLLAMNTLLYWVLSNNHSKAGWCAPTFSQAKSVLDQIVEASGNLVSSSNRMEATVSFTNGSTIKFLSADSVDSIRGYRFEYLIVDEAAFIKESTFTTSLLPTLNPTGRKVLIISTPKGKNWLFNWYNKPEVVSYTFKLEECPYINPTLIEEARKSLPPDIFKQEFEGQFIDSGNDVFTGIDKVSTIGMFSIERRVDVYAGIDTGLTSDMSVMTLLDPTGRTIWIEALNNRTIQDIAERFMSVLGNFNVVGGYVECNGIGKAMADLIRTRYSRIKEFYMTQDKKQDVVRKLINDIEEMNIELPSQDLCPELHSEFSTYTYKLSPSGKLSFSHMPGTHDDYLDSLMLANYSRIQFITKRNIRIRGGGSRVNKVTFGNLPS